MFRNYLKVALRHLRKQKAYALINITGFAVGMAACILIMMYVLGELSYDKFHRQADRIYRLGVEGNLSGNYVKYPVSNLGSGPTMLKDFPELECFTRMLDLGRITVTYQDKNFLEERLIYVDQYFFDVFSFRLKEGDPETVLKNPYSIVLTRSMADKYFGGEDPRGKQLRLHNHYNYTITGVVEDPPYNSHLKFDFLCSIETYYAINEQRVEEWNNFNNYTYLLLKDKVDPAHFAQKFPDFIDRYQATMKKLLGNEFSYFLQPLTDIHLHAHSAYEMPGNSDIAYIYVFSSIAFLILLIACINFMNLATARSASRAREIGLRKILGADKNRIIRQFLAESMLYCLFSMILALILVRLALPYFSELSGIQLGFHLREMPWLIPAFLGFTIATGLLAGSYPALMLSAYEPVRVIKGVLKARGSSIGFRRILVIVQFIISLTLITSTAIMMDQLNFMKNKKLGLDKEHVVVIPLADQEIREKIETIRADLKVYHGIINVSVASDVPGQIPDYSAFVPEGYTLETTQLMHRINCDADFIPTMGMELVAGRNFSPEFGTDPDQAAIINETAARTYGWDQPIGKKIGYFGSNDMDHLEYRTVIGVVKDFHVTSLHNEILPLQLTNNTTYYEDMIIRIRPDDIAGTLDYLQNRWKEYDPVRPFDSYFLDARYDALYQSDVRLNEIIRYFTAFAILVACLGLYGMASFMAEQRFKEIGIRKTLGASVPGIVALLSSEVTKLILLASVIAMPIAYFSLHRWLEGFAYRISIDPLTFIFSTILVLVIGYLTIAYQSVKAAMTNPVEVIRTE